MAALAIIVATSLAAQQVKPLRLVEEMRIDGAAEGLSYIGSVLVAPGGGVVIPQRDAAQLRFYDGTGKKTAVFGRAGQGPGEFDDIGYIGWHGDTLWVIDFNERRITYISRSLAVIRTVSTVAPAATSGPSDSSKRITMTNAILQHVYRDGTGALIWGFGPRDPESFSATDNRFIVVSPAGDIVRELGRLPPTSGRVFQRFGGGVASDDIPFAAHGGFSLSSDGNRLAILGVPVVNAGGGAYRITQLGSRGDTLFTRMYEYTPVRVPKSRLDSAFAAKLARAKPARDGTNVTLLMVEKERAAAPEFYAPVNGVLAGNDGTVWIELFDSAGAIRYRMLDARGNIVGDATLPARSRVVAATSAQLWVVMKDDDDVPSVVRYRVRS
jgi:hypothetical protein